MLAPMKIPNPLDSKISSPLEPLTGQGAKKTPIKEGRSSNG